MIDDEPRGRLEELRRRALEEEVPERVAQTIQDAVEMGASLDKARERLLQHVASEGEPAADLDSWDGPRRVVARLLRSYAPSLSDEAVAQMARLFQRATFKKGEELIRQDEPGDALYLLESGKVQVTRTSFGRGSAVPPAHVATLGAGAVVGEMSLIYNRPRNANVVAATHVRAHRLHKDGWIHIQAQFPVFAARIEEVARQRAQTLSQVSDPSALPEI